MAGLVSFDDTKRVFVLEVNGIQQELAYPADVSAFRDFQNARTYLSGFASLFIPAQPAPAADVAANSPDWL